MYKKVHHNVKNVLVQKYAELKTEVLSHKIIYLLLFVIISLAIFLRVYRTNELLWFFYDQGRDALVIWEFIKNGKPFLIGPITGLVGIYRGPFYYYLISPAYFVANGNPGGAAAFLGLLNALGLIIVFALGSKISRWVGLVAAFLGAISFNWIRNDRWLSNPSPISFFGPLALLLIYLSIKQPMKYLFWVGVVFGLNFQLESSGTFFNLFSLIVIGVIFKFYKNLKAIGLFFVGLFLTLIPQLLFEVRHGFQTAKNLSVFIAGGSNGGSSFGLFTKYQFEERAMLLFSNFMDKIEPNPGLMSSLIIILIVVCLLLAKSLRKNKMFLILVIWLVVPIVIAFFYRGNYDRFYSYYLNSLIPAFFLALAVALWVLWKSIPGKILAIVVLAFILPLQFKYDKFITDELKGVETIALGNQVKAIDWVYQDAAGKQFNMDFYVPPVVPYSYEYLFKWLGSTKYSYMPSDKQVADLYLIREFDSDRTKVNTWLERQNGIGRVEKVATFGGITVEKRQRIKYGN